MQSINHPNVDEDRNNNSLFITAKKDCEKGNQDTQYLVDQLIPENALILLSGPPKEAGKTTFCIHLAKALTEGLSFLGKPVEETDVLFMTEQPPSSFRSEYLFEHGLDESERLHCLYQNRALHYDWEELINASADEAQKTGADLLVVDTFLSFAGLSGGEENASGPVKDALTQIRKACSSNDMSVIVVHHDRKSGGSVIDAGRGSSAFQAIPDQILNLTKADNSYASSVRELKSAGRFAEIPSRQLISLEENGYVLVDCSETDLSDEIRKLLPTTPEKALRVGKVADSLAQKGLGKSESTVRRKLKELVESDDVKQVGDGHRSSPYRYHQDG